MKFCLLCLFFWPAMMAFGQQIPLPILPEEQERLLKRATELIEAAKKSKDLGERAKLLEEGEAAIRAAGAKSLDEAKKRFQELGLVGAPEPKAAEEAPAPKKPVAGQDPDDAALEPKPTKAPTKKAAMTDGLIKLEARKGNLSFEDKIGVFEEDVLVNHPAFTLKCDKLQILQGEGEDKKAEITIKTAIATGGMVTITNGKNKKGEPVEAKCRKATYTKDQLILENSTSIRQGLRTMKSDSASAKIVCALKGKVISHVHFASGDFYLVGPESKDAAKENQP